jgi:DNA-binding transcriptional regulator YdaS (Cro superfamily)
LSSLFLQSFAVVVIVIINNVVRSAICIQVVGGSVQQAYHLEPIARPVLNQRGLIVLAVAANTILLISVRNRKAR